MVVQITLRTSEENEGFKKNISNLTTAVDVNKCIKQILLPLSLQTYGDVYYYALPSNLMFLWVSRKQFIDENPRHYRSSQCLFAVR